MDTLALLAKALAELADAVVLMKRQQAIIDKMEERAAAQDIIIALQQKIIQKPLSN